MQNRGADKNKIEIINQNVLNRLQHLQFPQKPLCSSCRDLRITFRLLQQQQQFLQQVPFFKHLTIAAIREIATASEKIRISKGYKTKVKNERIKNFHVLTSKFNSEIILQSGKALWLREW